MILIKVRNGELFFSRKKIHIAKQDEHMVKKRTTERWREGEGKKDGWVSWVEQRKQQNVILFCWKKKSPMAMIMNLFGSYRTRRGSVLPSHLCNLKLGGKRAHKMALIRSLQQEQWVHKRHCLDSWKRNGGKEEGKREFGVSKPKKIRETYIQQMLLWVWPMAFPTWPQQKVMRRRGEGETKDGWMLKCEVGLQN